MKTERFEIKNRHGLKLVIKVDSPDKPDNLVFICHGRGGAMVQNHIQAFGQAFLENNFRVVFFDSTNSLGQSEGDMLNLTYDTYMADLEDAISWARQQAWFQEPFSLCGQSMGAQAVAWYAEHHPDEIKYLAPIAPVVNFELWSKTMAPGYLKKWEEDGFVAEPSRSLPGVIGKTGWGLVESQKKYDLMPLADRLTMPVFFMAGEFDQPCPPKNQQVLFDAIPSKNKKFVKIADAEHGFRNNETQQYGQEVQEAKAALSSWLHELNRLTP
jgi:pimeloyl-ACP methyl ester carboxylesterase